MITQEQFVAACHKYYSRNNIEPGDPEFGEWHRAHYPLPRCLGGTETVWLLKQHHAIQGVIQSEELQHRCIYRWEIDLLPRYYLPYGIKWIQKRSFNPTAPRKARKDITSEWHRLTWPTLLEELQDKIDANPCPGHRIRLYAFAQNTIQHVGKDEWYELFQWYGICNRMLSFPVEVTELDIDAIERQLIELVNEDNVVPATALTTVLQCSANSKQYRTVKEGLTQRGWHWAHQRSGSSTQRVIRPPCPQVR